MTPYRAVIGLAGHVDHGKTLLIKALTGITTARAHEQAIGMTQDLEVAIACGSTQVRIGTAIFGEL